MSEDSNSSPAIPQRRLLRRQNQALYGGAWQEHKFKQGSFLLDTGRRFFTVRAAKHGAGCPERWGNFCIQRFLRPKWTKPCATSSAFNDKPVLSRRFGFCPLNYSVILYIIILVSSVIYM